MILEVRDHFSALPVHDWIATNLQKIQTRDPNDFSFVVFGDNKNSHATLKTLLKQVDHEPDVAFAIDLGDLVYDGEKQKYRYFFNQVLSNLPLPLLTAIGNHELRENIWGLVRVIRIGKRSRLRASGLGVCWRQGGERMVDMAFRFCSKAKGDGLKKRKRFSGRRKSSFIDVSIQKKWKNH